MVDRSAQMQIKRRLTDLTKHVGAGRHRAPPSRLQRAHATDEPNAVAAKLNYLREAEVFASLTASEWTWLAESTTMVTCDRGRVFYTPDEQGEVVFLLKRGRVDLYRLAQDGRKLVVATLGAHTLFGEMSLIGQQMYGCFAEAADDCLLCVLSRNDLQALIRRNPEVGLRLLADLGNRLQQREAELEALVFQNLPARLAGLLVREADSFGTVVGFSHQDFADRLGTYRETVSQILGRFRTEGLIAVEPRRIRIVDMAGLASKTKP